MKMYPSQYFLQYDDLSYSNAERKMFNIFNKMPNTDDWVCFHSLRFVNTNNVFYSDKEIDFLIFIPDRGVLFLEIKGGRIEFNSQNKTFTTQNKFGKIANIKDPLNQIREAKYALCKKISNEWQENIFHFSAISIIFPDCVFDKENLPEEYREYTFSEKDLPNLHSNIIKIFPNILPKRYEFSIKRIIDILSFHDVKSEVSFNSVINYHKEARKVATDEQIKILSILSLCNNVIINGVAGSGKTILALTKALEYAREHPNEKVLYLCYTRLLSAHIKKMVQEDFGLPDNLHISTYNEFANIFLGENFPTQPKKEDWEKNIPLAVQKSGKAYSAICVDEAQDFTLLQLSSLQDILLSENSIFWIFGDKNQSVIKTKYDFDFTQFFNGNYVFPLFTNCRNPVKIGEYAYTAISNSKYKISKFAEEGNLNLVQCNNLEEQAHKLKLLIENNGYLSDNTIIISMKYLSKSKECSLFNSLDKNRYCEFESLQNIDSKLPITNIQNFKGLEKEVVILVDVDKETNLIDLYTASTRSLTELHVFYMRALTKE